MLTRNETKGKLLFKDGQKWSILLPPGYLFFGVFMTLLGSWLISYNHSSLEKIVLSSIMIFFGLTFSFIGVLGTSVA
ncbi:MAG: hypothetical protein ACW987_20900, partial [Candidatus Thorarchaeota archaeon]